MRPAIVLLGLLAAVSAELPATLEIDVVFPRNDTYRRIYPFPIVFALSNAHEAWPYGIDFEWVVAPRPYQGLSKSADGVPDLGWLEDTDEYSSGTLKQMDTMFVIEAAHSIINRRDATEWAVTVTFALRQNCTGPATDANPTTRVKFANSVAFTISDDGGKLPEIMPSDGACAAPVATANMARSFPDTSMTSGEWPRCVALNEQDPHPAGDPCSLRIPEELVKNVTTMMLAVSDCLDTGNWPDVNRTTDCGDFRRSRNSALSAVVPALGAMIVATTMALAWL